MLSYLFPGQGSQIKNMGRALFDAYPDLVEQANEILGYSIQGLCCEDDQQQLNKTQFTQPAIYIVSVLSYLYKIEQGKKVPDFIAGHSLGELSALHVAGAMSFVDGLRLVKKRGELMSQAQQGAMAAVLGLSYDEVFQCLQNNNLTQIDIANINAPTQIVISGLQQNIADAQAIFEKCDATFVFLNTSGAFHSRHMDWAKTEFEKYMQEFNFSDFNIPVVANVDAQFYKQANIKTNLAKQITHPVKWLQSIEHLLDLGVDEFEEVGPGNVLTKLFSKIKHNSVVKKQVSLDEIVLSSLKVEAEQAFLKKEIDDWNTVWSIGTEVTAEGFTGPLMTRAPAIEISGQKAGLYVDGYKGYLPLGSVRVKF